LFYPVSEALRLWPVSEVCQQRTVAASMYSAEALNVDGGDGDCPLLGFASAAAPASPTPPIQMATEAERLLTGQQLFLSQKVPLSSLQTAHTKFAKLKKK
jgi:hypothetical protein